MTGDGRFRLELQSEAGDAQIVSDGKRVTLYDASSKTAYLGALPERRRRQGQASTSAAVARASPTRRSPARPRRGRSPAPSRRSTAGQPSYTVRIAPEGRRRPARRRRARVGRRARRAAARRRLRPGPGRSGARAGGHRHLLRRRPRVATSQADRPRARRVVDVDPPAGHDAQGRAGRGRAASTAVPRGCDFPLAAPDELAGLPRQERAPGRRRRRAGAPSAPTARASAGSSCSQRKATATPQSERRRARSQLPQINIDGATGNELATALGTLVTFERDGVAYIVPARSRRSAAENAARGLR